MTANLENRDKTRFEHVTAVTFENKEIGVQRSARMYNYSDGGLYFETDQHLEPETKIRLSCGWPVFQSEFFRSEYLTYYSVVLIYNYAAIAARLLIG